MFVNMATAIETPQT